MKDKNSLKTFDIDLETNVCQTCNRATGNNPSISYWTNYMKKSQKSFLIKVYFFVKKFLCSLTLKNGYHKLPDFRQN